MRPWHRALAVASRNAGLRWRVQQLERRVLQQARDLAVKDDRIRALTADLGIVRLCARDRVAVDEFLAVSHDLHALEDPEAFGGVA